MADRETVIKGLEMCRVGHCDYRCPYASINVGCKNQLLDDAITLLKEQEAVEPVTESSVYDPDIWFFVCGSCKKCVIDREDKFCRWCGQAVKWDG